MSKYVLDNELESVHNDLEHFFPENKCIFCSKEIEIRQNIKAKLYKLMEKNTEILYNTLPSRIEQVKQSVNNDNTQIQLDVLFDFPRCTECAKKQNFGDKIQMVVALPIILASFICGLTILKWDIATSFGLTALSLGIAFFIGKIFRNYYLKKNSCFDISKIEYDHEWGRKKFKDGWFVTTV